MPKLRTSEAIAFLDKKNLKYVDKRMLNGKELKGSPFNYKKGFSFKKFYSMRAEYILVGFSENQNQHKFFWVALTKCFFPLLKFLYVTQTEEQTGGRSLNIKEIESQNILSELTKRYQLKIVLIKNKCPACQYNITNTMSQCPSCGLNLIA